MKQMEKSRSGKAGLLWLWLGLVPAAGLYAPCALAQTPSFTASAAVPVQEDLVRAREQALSDALGRALEQAVAQVAPEARSRLYLLLGRARDYVTTYRVLDEGELAGQFQIHLEVQFDLSRLLHDLQAPAAPEASDRSTAATVTLCTPAATPDAQAALGAARALLSEYTLATESLSAQDCAEQWSGAPSRPGNRGAGAMLLVLSPDKNPQREEIRGTQPQRYGAVAHVEWQLFAQPARPEGTAPASVKEPGEATVFLDSADGAVAEAQRLAALAALNRLISRPGVLLSAAKGVMLDLENVGSYANYQSLLKEMWALPGVLRVEPRRFLLPSSGKADEQVQVLLHTSASPESIGAALGRAPLGGLRLQVAPVGPAELRVICAAVSALPAASDENPPESTETGGMPGGTF